MSKTKVTWILDTTYVEPFSSYLVSVKGSGFLYTMAAYCDYDGIWYAGSGDKINGQVYAVANLPDPMPLAGL